MLPLILRRLKMSLLAAPANGNGGKCYAGRYHSGQAVYFYDDSPDGRLYHGKFWFARRYYNPPYGIAAEKAAGCFNDGAKEGRWTFSNKARGRHRKLTIEYAEGHHRGLYSYKEVSRMNGKRMGSEVTTLRMNLGHGHPTGSVWLATNSYTMTGSYDADGQPDGLWKIDQTRTEACKTDYEEWEHGVCRKSYSINESTGKTTDTKSQMPHMVASLIYNECMPLERLMPKGSSIWTGRY